MDEFLNINDLINSMYQITNRCDKLNVITIEYE